MVLNLQGRDQEADQEGRKIVEERQQKLKLLSRTLQR
jgi:hypothetical protein